MGFRQVIKLACAHAQPCPFHPARADCQQRLQRLVAAGLRIAVRIEPGQNTFGPVRGVKNQPDHADAAADDQKRPFAQRNACHQIGNQAHAENDHACPHVRLDGDKRGQRRRDQQRIGKQRDRAAVEPRPDIGGSGQNSDQFGQLRRLKGSDPADRKPAPGAVRLDADKKDRDQKRQRNQRPDGDPFQKPAIALPDDKSHSGQPNHGGDKMALQKI